MTQSMLMLLPMILVFYFIVMRPQMKKQKETQAMLAALKKGDLVLTRGGLIGKISGIKDNELILELQEKVRVRVLRSYVESKYESAPADEKTDAAKKAA